MVYIDEPVCNHSFLLSCSVQKKWQSTQKEEWAGKTKHFRTNKQVVEEKAVENLRIQELAEQSGVMGTKRRKKHGKKESYVLIGAL